MISQKIKDETDAAFDQFRGAAKGLFDVTMSGPIEREGGFYAWAYLKASKRMSQALSADREILLLVTTFRDQQARTMKVASELIETSNGRVETSIAVIVHGDPNGNSKLQSWGRERGITVLPITLDPAKRISKPEELEAALCRELYAFDLFDVSGPVSDDRNFYGRRTEAQDMARQLQAGQIRACLGIRKIGKTSIVNRIVEEIRTNHSCAALMVDGSRDDIWRLTAAQLINSIAATVEGLGSDKGYLPLNPKSESIAMEAAVQRLQRAVGGMNIPLVIFFDEIDYITPGSPTAPHWRTEFNPFWRNLRAVYQEAARTRIRMSFFLSGVSSKWFRCEAVEGIENAALALVPEEYLSPLPRGASVAMIKQLARKVGLQMSDEVCDLVAEAGADMPYWIRKAGSFVHRHTDVVGRPLSVTIESVTALLKLFVETEGRTLAQVALSHLFRVYPDLQKDALAVASGAGGTTKNDSVGTLIRYGVVREKTGGSLAIAGPMMLLGLNQIALNSAAAAAGADDQVNSDGVSQVDALGDWAEELAVLGRRRNIIEKKLRGLVVNFVRFDSLQKGQKVIDRLAAAVREARRDELRHLSPDDFAEKMYWLELTQLIAKEWALFGRLFGDKISFDQFAKLVNERPDAHAKSLDLADVALHRRALEYFESAIAKG